MLHGTNERIYYYISICCVFCRFLVATIQNTPGSRSDLKCYERREDADVQGRFRERRIHEH